ncbi:MAG: HAMP domain-containing protein [Cyanobacteria bacterium SZAS-4]|nr:HAMP domain-containing protein [Cyanobacteria bacterium SZAS-4]
MRVRFPLYAQTISFLLIHLILLVVLFLALFNTKFGPGWDAVLSSPIGDRVEAIGWVIQKQLEVNKPDEWNTVLDEFGKFYGVDFYLFDFAGKQLAGQTTTLPEAVSKEVIRHRRNPPGDRPAGAGQVAPADPEGKRPQPPDGPDADGPPQPQDQPAPPDVNRPGPPGPDRHGPPDPNHPESPPERLPPQTDIPQPTIFGQAKVTPPGAMRRRFRGRFILHTTAPDKFWIGIRIPVSRNQKIVPGTLLASADNLWQTGVFFDFKPVLILVGSVLLLSVIFWWPFAYRITRALAEMTKVTEKIAEGRFESRVKVNKWDEIGSMGEAVNQLASRLNTFVTGEKRFLGDIAHELSSPLARLQIGLELLETTATKDQESMINDIREEVEEMTHLINELLAFSKAGLQGKEIELKPINLAKLLIGVTLKTASEQIVKLDVDKDLSVLGDQMLLERAFGNVFRNAVRYASADGDIKVKALRSGKEISIITSDSGPGVPPAALEHLTEPFFRPEPSRSRSSGGTGLGLAIVQTCIESCNGSLAIRNRQPRGLEVEIRLESAPESGSSEPSSPQSATNKSS